MPVLGEDGAPDQLKTVELIFFMRRQFFFRDKDIRIDKVRGLLYGVDSLDFKNEERLLDAKRFDFDVFSGSGAAKAYP